VAGPPIGVLAPGPVWHCSIATQSLPLRAVLEQEAERQLAGVGDASLGEWREHNGRFFHLRRRLSEAEERQTGPALDIRRTPEAVARAMRLGSMLRLAPPEVLAEEIGAVLPAMTQSLTAAGESGTRPCAYCGEQFDPEGTGRLYCSLQHRKKAAYRRHCGNDQRQPPERTLTCPWCGEGFTTRLEGQVFCGAAHRKRAMSCERRRGFLTLAAAEAAAAETTGSVESYRCPHVTAREHWHLGNVGQASGTASAEAVSS
jgi:hypothetical protein